MDPLSVSVRETASTKGKVSGAKKFFPDLLPAQASISTDISWLAFCSLAFYAWDNDIGLEIYDNDDWKESSGASVLSSDDGGAVANSTTKESVRERLQKRHQERAEQLRVARTGMNGAGTAVILGFVMLFILILRVLSVHGVEGLQKMMNPAPERF